MQQDVKEIALSISQIINFHFIFKKKHNQIIIRLYFRYLLSVVFHFFRVLPLRHSNTTEK